jgi:hypothetical protein
LFEDSLRIKLCIDESSGFKELQYGPGIIDCYTCVGVMVNNKQFYLIKERVFFLILGYCKPISIIFNNRFIEELVKIRYVTPFVPWACTLRENVVINDPSLTVLGIDEWAATAAPASTSGAIARFEGKDTTI